MDFDDYTAACRYTINKIEVTDSVSEEELASTILYEIQNQIEDGVSVRQLCRIITDYYGVASNYCCDLIQRIKLELGMYCPDGGHLYYA